MFTTLVSTTLGMGGNIDSGSRCTEHAVRVLPLREPGHLGARNVALQVMIGLGLSRIFTSGRISSGGKCLYYVLSKARNEADKMHLSFHGQLQSSDFSFNFFKLKITLGYQNILLIHTKLCLRLRGHEL
ncbi:hypothetical protein CDAR_107981 [Caerostris darwini]|uniref:Uncharacterized protein n=1 Tax=Caerostris darwini TaxID=1538125 RepID=A0AAV4X207_9ARAC|nr:hypothetical protein CDAR_107981 [Caerostris darwini]